MRRWFRTAPLTDADDKPQTEIWEARDAAAGSCIRFEVEVTVGKPLNVMSLKGANLDDVRSYGRFLAQSAAKLYDRSALPESVQRCPICAAPLACAATMLRVFEVPYVRCPDCRHVLVGQQPTAAALAQVFSDSEEHSSIYVDRAALEVRMAEVVQPKLDWCLRQAARLGLPRPRRVLDVGAGGGHFLACAARSGMAVEGFEMSKASRAFAAEAFGLGLRSDDFLQQETGTADLITFWGLLEYIQEPRQFLSAARRVLARDGLLVVEVPRVDALGTLVQALPNAVIGRHMDPTSHINAFSDLSLATALLEEGFAPVAAWYFGMDAWEALVQVSLASGADVMAPHLTALLPALQAAVDRGRQCDDIVVAAVPLERR